MSFIECSKEVFALVRTTDTPVAEIYEALSGKYPIATISLVLEKLNGSSIYEVEPGVYQRWHGEKAQRVIEERGISEEVYGLVSGTETTSLDQLRAALSSRHPDASIIRAVQWLVDGGPIVEVAPQVYQRSNGPAQALIREAEHSK